MSVPMYSPAKVELDVEEIIALLKKTSLPTVIVEGSDDMIVYRRFEIRLAHLGISIFPVCGRKKVLDIFLRKSEIPADVKLVFVADQDTWVNTGVPAQYQSSQMVLTTGYSIENDVFMDGNLVSLLKGQEVAKFSSELESFVEWYSLALSRHLNGSNHLISLHPDHVLNPVQRPALLALCAESNIQMHCVNKCWWIIRDSCVGSLSLHFWFGIRTIRVGNLITPIERSLRWLLFGRVLCCNLFLAKWRRRSQIDRDPQCHPSARSSLDTISSCLSKFAKNS